MISATTVQVIFHLSSGADAALPAAPTTILRSSHHPTPNRDHKMFREVMGYFQQTSSYTLDNIPRLGEVTHRIGRR